MAGASPELGQEMELLLYGRLGHYSRSVERLRARAEKQRAELHAARLLQRLSRGQRGRALVKAKRTEIESVAANLGAAGLASVRAIAGPLLAYAISYNAIPFFRSKRLKKKNADVDRRNANRARWADLARRPSAALRAKLAKIKEKAPEAFEADAAAAAALKKVARNFVASDRPLGEAVPGGDLDQVSAGHTSHPATTAAATDAVFAFLAERLAA